MIDSYLSNLPKVSA